MLLRRGLLPARQGRRTEKRLQQNSRAVATVNASGEECCCTARNRCAQSSQWRAASAHPMGTMPRPCQRENTCQPKVSHRVSHR